MIPPAVANELERGIAIGVDLPDVRALPWLKIQAPEGLDKVPTAADLGAGEKEVLALGIQYPGAIARETGRPDSPDRALGRTSRSLRISLIGENTRSSPQAGWRMSGKPYHEIAYIN